MNVRYVQTVFYRVHLNFSTLRRDECATNMPQKAVHFNELLVKSIDEAVTELLGEKGRQSLYRHLAEHYDVTRDEIPYRLDALHVAINRTLGNKAADVLDIEIVKYLARQIKVPLPDTRDISLQKYLLRASKLVA